eukprot:11167604-Lingulodinium_polyedra.AAC.1
MVPEKSEHGNSGVSVAPQCRIVGQLEIAVFRPPHGVGKVGKQKSLKLRCFGQPMVSGKSGNRESWH